MPWAKVYCPGCKTTRSIDIRTLDRHHPLASVGALVLQSSAHDEKAPAHVPLGHLPRCGQDQVDRRSSRLDPSAYWSLNGD
jgi:hypothetical protein